MNILIVGSGGREHALAWKVSQSPRLSHLFVAPGNSGTALAGLKDDGADTQNVPIPAEDRSALVAFALEKDIDLVIVGPEGPLAAGLADEMGAAGQAVFGPSRVAAQIEASKAFAKAFMTRHGIPTASYATFADFEPALRYLRKVDFPMVVKASGLTAGKGVLLPESLDEAEDALRQVMLRRRFGAAGDEVVIEERLIGEEVSLLAFTDGLSVRPMPPAQDHKRLLDGDQGPNTGGMGAYAPAPVCPPSLVEEITHRILQPTVDGLRAEGRPFAGVLYAGLILTDQGPQVLEFNCRFGDPETQVLLPLLETDLVEIAEACVAGRLAEVEVRWKSGAAACVVLASPGYPGSYPKGRLIYGLGPDTLPTNSVVFHAGARFDPRNGEVITAGGRVLGVTGWGGTSNEALRTAYAAVESISFEGMHYRHDIGHRAVRALG